MAALQATNDQNPGAIRSDSTWKGLEDTIHRPRGPILLCFAS
jgi:hypothetical protein